MRSLGLGENECQTAQFVLRALAPRGGSGSEHSLAVTAGRSEVARGCGQVGRGANGFKGKKQEE
jgi:hypothetical protein